MRIFLDINHPSHFHFFRNFILKARKNGHDLVITVREKDHLPHLMQAYAIPYFSKGRGARSLTGKLLNLVRETIFILNKASRFRPGLFLSFASPYAALAGKLLGKRVITFDDTEPDPLLHLIFPPFSDVVLTPHCYRKSFGKKHLRFNGYKELAYMSRTIAGKNIREKLNLSENKPLAVVRFVSHGATHSLGEKGLPLRFKIQSATTLSEYAHVVVSSEEDLPFALKKYALKCSPDELHRLMASADVLFGESTTMAAESAVLGIPSVVIENKGRGYLTDLQQRFGVVQHYTTREKDKALEAAVQVLQNSPSKAERQSIAEQIREGTTDVTALLLWITGNFPESLEELLKNPGILARFDREKGNSEIS